MNEKVIQIDYKNKKIYLIPTAHVSVESAKMVEETIDEIKPDSICIELDVLQILHFPHYPFLFCIAGICQGILG